MDLKPNFCRALTWEELSKLAALEVDRVNGPNNPYASMRLFGRDEKEIRVTLYRDHHAWCPYCQKVWLWLEWKRIPYKIKKVTMFCYGKKESWYLNKVPSGMLPAIEIDNQLFTESDQILLELEKRFGALGLPLEDSLVLELRHLERKLFRAWCIWLCQPFLIQRQDDHRKIQFQQIAKEMETQIKKNDYPWLDPLKSKGNDSCPGSADIIFIPYLERMNASLAYYKGFNLREEHPLINIWFKALEESSTYRGSQGDFHTHSHDLPPQMGGCFFSKNKQQEGYVSAIDNGYGLSAMETSFDSAKLTIPNQNESIALQRVIKHKDQIKEVNVIDQELFDQSLRAALTRLISGKLCKPTSGAAIGLRYLRDRISVPRDMPLMSARKLRIALEETASLDGKEQGPSIPLSNRLDQNPEPFLINK